MTADTSRKRSPRPDISPLILMPWLTHASAFGETAGAASAGRCGEGIGEGEVSGEGCGLFASALRHIRLPHAANSEAAEVGMPADQAGGNMKIVRGSEGVKEKGQSSSKVDGFQGGYTQRTSARPSGQN